MSNLYKLSSKYIDDNIVNMFCEILIQKKVQKRKCAAYLRAILVFSALMSRWMCWVYERRMYKCVKFGQLKIKYE